MSPTQAWNVSAYVANILKPRRALCLPQRLLRYSYSPQSSCRCKIKDGGHGNESVNEHALQAIIDHFDHTEKNLIQDCKILQSNL